MKNFIIRIKGFFESDDKSTAKAALYYLMCQVLVKGMAFITTPIFSRIMSKSEYGMVSSFLAWEAVLYPIMTLNLRATVSRSKYKYRDDNDSYLATILTTSGIVILLFYLFVELCHGFVSNVLGMEIKYVRMLLLYILFYMAFDYQQIQYNIYHKYRLYVVYSIVSCILSLSLSVGLVLILEEKAFGRVLGIVIPTILIGALIYLNAYRRAKRLKKEYIKYAVRMAIPLIPSALSTTILSSSDRIIIKQFCGEEQTAMYTIPYTIASIAAILWTALNQAWGPWLYDHLDKKEYGRIKEVSKKFVVIYAILIIALMLIAPELLLILGGKQYISTIATLPPVILAMVFQFFYAFYVDVEYFYGETYIISFGTLMAAVINIVLNIIFIPRYGYVAASYTTLVGYFIMMMYHFMIVKLKLKKSYIYSNKYFFIIILGLTLIQILCMGMYHNNIVRYITIGAYVVLITIMLIKNKVLVKKVINKFTKKG